jgi:hypothetical protein
MREFKFCASGFIVLICLCALFASAQSLPGAVHANIAAMSQVQYAITNPNSEQTINYAWCVLGVALVLWTIIKKIIS